MLGFERDGPGSSRLESWAGPDGSVVAVGVDARGDARWASAHGELGEAALEELRSLG
jgi:hypothetical protein